MKIEVTPRPEQSEIMFTEQYEDGSRSTYWKTWWCGHWHALRLIFAGHDLHYVEPVA